jgi:hypothetical protein
MLQTYWKVLVGNPQGKRPLGRLRYRGKNIKLDLKEIGYES